MVCNLSGQGLPARLTRLTRSLPAIASATTGPSRSKPLPSASAWTFGLRLGLVHLDGAVTHVGPVECGNRLFGAAGIAHFDECEAACTPSIAVGDDVDALDWAIHPKSITQVCFGGAVR